MSTRPAARRAVITVLASICVALADAFSAASIGGKSLGVAPSPSASAGRPRRATTSLLSTLRAGAVDVETIPSWDELSQTLLDTAPSAEPEKSLVTLYRDTNGWCPFCERVWLILRAKGIPYDEQLVSLQNKPEWYKALVPTTLVPAVLFHGTEGKNERRVVWESSDIIAALDEEFPDAPKMLRDSREYEAAVKMNEDLTSAGFGFVYAGRNDTLSEEDRAERKAKFLAELDRLDAALEEQQRGLNDAGGSFRLGEDFTAVDALMIPTLERWRYQLPLTAGVDILEGRPALAGWFERMDSYEPYSDRVAGDAYSWTATNSMFLRYFGGGEDRPEIAEGIRRADAAAERLAGSFAEGVGDEEAAGEKRYSREAAAKLVANHEAVAKDCTRDDPLSQKHVGRASSPDVADAVLRHVAGLLLSDEDAVLRAREGPLPDVGGGSRREDAARAARTVAARLCVPRDMGAPAASVLRAVLAIVADRLDD